MKWEEFRKTGILQTYTSSRFGRKRVWVHVSWNSKKYGKGHGYLRFEGLGKYNRLVLYDFFGYYYIPLHEIKTIKIGVYQEN